MKDVVGRRDIAPVPNSGMLWFSEFTLTCGHHVTKKAVKQGNYQRLVCPECRASMEKKDLRAIAVSKMQTDKKTFDAVRHDPLQLEVFAHACLTKLEQFERLHADIVTGRGVSEAKQVLIEALEQQVRDLVQKGIERADEVSRLSQMVNAAHARPEAMPPSKLRPGQCCRRCGAVDKMNFHVADTLWEAVAGPEFFNEHTDSVLCLACFDDLATVKGIEYTPQVITFVGESFFIEFSMKPYAQRRDGGYIPGSPGDSGASVQGSGVG